MKKVAFDRIFRMEECRKMFQKALNDNDK